MSVLAEAGARAILDKAIEASKADECTATLSGARGGNIRYALNSVSTSGYPVRNFRFNESLVVALNNIEAVGRPVRVLSFEDPTLPMYLPPVRVREFTFTSLSDAI